MVKKAVRNWLPREGQYIRPPGRQTPAIPEHTAFAVVMLVAIVLIIIAIVLL